MEYWDTALTYFSGSGLDTLAIDSTGAATQDGSELIAKVYNNGIFGWQNALMYYAGLTPDGVVEAKTTAQFIEAIGKGWGIRPGTLRGWFLNDSPAVTGDRVLLLQGQGVLIASYPELDDNVWCTDAGPGGSPSSGYNAIVAAGGGAFYRASDAAGTTPDIAGPYLILPDMRGYVPRGLDIAAAVDPDGASRFLGDNQVDAFQGHHHDQYFDSFVAATVSGSSWAGIRVDATTNNLASAATTDSIRSPKTDGVNGVPRTNSETRMSNISIHWGITY